MRKLNNKKIDKKVFKRTAGRIAKANAPKVSEYQRGGTRF